MLSIDEAIAREKALAEIYRNDIVPKEDYHNMPWIDMENESNMRIAKEHEQLAEWLEELKAIKDGSIPIIHEKAELELHDKAIRNEAIDDFVKKICEKYTEEESKGNYKQYCGEIKQAIADLAEQLKEGRNNENYNKEES